MEKLTDAQLNLELNREIFGDQYARYIIEGEMVYGVLASSGWTTKGSVSITHGDFRVHLPDFCSSGQNCSSLFGYIGDPDVLDTFENVLKAIKPRDHHTTPRDRAEAMLIALRLRDPNKELEKPKTTTVIANGVFSGYQMPMNLNWYGNNVVVSNCVFDQTSTVAPKAPTAKVYADTELLPTDEIKSTP
jgi:hypothetical protein